ncbi:MAG: 23S rRNA (adenine(2030)-N(6))-methyltransferase RlmJ [Pseudomonadota bacterium]
MLSYQHAYHAGNLADVHKHALLAVMLEYAARKDKPLSYIETHAGRGLYDLGAPEAVKTGEAKAAAGATRAFAPDHPYLQALEKTRQTHGQGAYPGSPLIARTLLRDTDSLHLAELHPAEHAALRGAVPRANIAKEDGFAFAHSRTPPTPRRGLMLIDPSYEVKSDYAAIPGHIARLTKAWNVGIITLWYPVLTNQAHQNMVKTITTAHPQALHSQVRFAPARKGHGMVGSGLIVLNPPYPLASEAARLEQWYAENLKGTA